MTYSFSKLTVLATSLLLSVAAIEAKSAQAAIVTYDFGGILDSGALNGENYSGFFSFDNSTLTVSTVELQFFGATFSQADADAPPTVEFSNSEFLGLSFSVTDFDPSFSLNPGSFALSDASFSYALSSGNAGFGDVTYTLRQPTTPVPEPTSLFGLLTLGIVGAIAKAKVNKQ